MITMQRKIRRQQLMRQTVQYIQMQFRRVPSLSLLFSHIPLKVIISYTNSSLQNVKLFRLRIVVHLKFHLCSFCVICLKTDGEQRDLYGTKAEMVMAEVAAASGGSHQSLQQLSSRGSKFNLMAGGSGSGGSGGTGMKTKWMKAFRTLTSSSSSQNVAVPGSTSSTTGSSPPLVNNNSVATDQ